jgi:hypothetical protein
MQNCPAEARALLRSYRLHCSRSFAPLRPIAATVACHAHTLPSATSNIRALSGCKDVDAAHSR